MILACGVPSQNRPTLYAKAGLETTASLRGASGGVSDGLVWGNFLFTIRWRGTTLSQGIPIHRAVENKHSFHHGGCNEGFGNFAFPSACGSGVQRRAG